MESARRRARGTRRAQYNLGLMYKHARGVPQDYVAAHMWLNLAGAQSSGDECDTSRVRKHGMLSRFTLTPEQIAEAQRLAREWHLRRWNRKAGTVG